MTPDKPNSKQPVGSLPQTDATFRFLFEDHPVPMWVYDLKTLAFLAINHAAQEKYGYSKTEFLQMTLKDIRPAQEIALLQSHVKQARPALQHSGIWHHQLKDGRVIDVEITSHTIEFEGRSAVLVFAQDVTERIQAEHQLITKNNELAFINQMATQLTMLHTSPELYAFLARSLKEHTGAVSSSCGVYNPELQEIHVEHAEMDEGIISDLVSASGDKRLQEARFPVNAELRQALIENPVSFRSNFSEAIFGVVPPTIGQIAQGIDRYVGVAYVVEDTLFGTSLLALRKNQPDPSFDLLMSFGHLAALSLRRMQAEDRLVESEDRFRATFEQAAVGVAHVATDGRWLVVNQKLCEILGYSHDELMTKTIQDITHPEDLEMGWGYVRQMLAGEIHNYALEKRYIRKDGSLVWINLTVSLVRQPNGDPKYIIKIIEDISKRKKIEEELATNQRLMQDISDNSASLIYATDLEGRILLINRQLESVFGSPREKWIGKTREAMLPPEIAAAHRSNDLRVIDKQKAIIIEEENIQPDGKHIFLSVKFPLIDSRGVLYGVAGISTDITQQQKEKAKLQESEWRFSTIFKESPVPASLSRLSDSKILEINDAWVSTMGFSKDEVIGKFVDDLGIIDSNTRAMIKKEFLEKGALKNIDITVYSKNGDPKTVLASIVPITINDEEYLMDLFVDITEQKRVTTQLNEQLDELRRWQSATLGREMRILELKSEVNSLLKAMGKQPQYMSVEEEK